MSLNETERAAVSMFIQEEEKRRRHLLVTLGGSHAYGYSSSGSDIDLEGIHIEPTDRILGVSSPSASVRRSAVMEDAAIDYISTEIKDVVLGVIQGNGSIIERVLSKCVIAQMPNEHAELCELVSGSLSRNIYKHYRGFATGQLRGVAKEASVKKMIYVMRITLSGAHALSTGQVVTDINYLLDTYGFTEARLLIDEKRAGRSLSQDFMPNATKNAERAFGILDRAFSTSCLPVDPPSVPILERWLIDLRKRF